MPIQQYLYRLKFPFILIAMLSVFSSCQVDENLEPTQILEADVAIAIEGAILPNSGGLISQIKSTVLQGISAAALGCNIVKDSTLNQVTDSRNSYSYTWMLENECDLDKIPFELTSILKGNRRYLSAQLSANEKIETTMYLSRFGNLVNPFNLSLISETEGSYRVGNDILDGYVGKISFVGIDINVDKTSQEISSGSVNFLFSGAAISGRFFNYDGRINFEGNKRATIVFTNGGNYVLNW